MHTIYVRAGERYYRLRVGHQWAVRNDNGALVSCGLTVGVDLRQSQLDALIRRGQAVEVSKEVWEHCGCQSSCILRGGKECRW